MWRSHLARNRLMSKIRMSRLDRTRDRVSILVAGRSQSIFGQLGIEHIFIDGSFLHGEKPDPAHVGRILGRARRRCL